MNRLVRIAAAVLALAAGAPNLGAPLAAPAVLAAQSAAPASPPTSIAPRTLRGQTHMYAAFAIAWVLLFGYVLSLGSRWKQVEQQLRSTGAGTPPPA